MEAEPAPPLLQDNQPKPQNDELSRVIGSDAKQVVITSTTTSMTKAKNEKNRCAGGGGAAGNTNKSHQFRAPQQFAQQKKKMWNKRQKCHFQKHLHAQQPVISKADLENIQNVKNQMGVGGGGVGAAGVGVDVSVVKNSKPQVYKKNGGGIAGNNLNGVIVSGPVFGPRSKFFLPDKPPRKETIIPPTKFLLGGNISDPLNLNSLQNEAINSNNNTPGTTPRQSPITTPPKVEVIIPPNIHDPLHLLDPVDSMEYEKQLTSPLKKKSKSKHRNRKKKPKRRRLESMTSGDDNATVNLSTEASESLLSADVSESAQHASGNEAESGSVNDFSSFSEIKVTGNVLTSTDVEDSVVSSTTANLSTISCSTAITPSDCVSSSTAAGLSASGRSAVDRERIKKDLLLDLSAGESVGSGQRKRKTSESQGSGKNKFRRLEAMDKIVSPVVPQPGAWKRPPRMVPTGSRKSARIRSTSVSETEILSPIEETKNLDIETTHSEQPEAPTNEISIANVTSEPPVSGKPLPPTAAKPKFREDGAKYQYGNYDRYSGYRRLNQYMDVRLQVFQRNPELFTGKDILDIGCNVGHMTIAVARNLAPKTILGVDIDKNLVSRARRNLSLFVRIPQEEVKVEEEQTSDATNKLKPNVKAQKSKHKKFAKKRQHKQPAQAPAKNPLGVDQTELFPISFPICLGGIPTKPNIADGEQPSPLPSGSGQQQIKNQFPKNVFFRQLNYVLKDESLLSNDSQQYDLILCLSVTKWIHLNFGDNGLKLAFKRMFNQLRPGGKLILEAQNWASYKKKKNLTETIYKNYTSIEFFPNKFHEYLLSNEVGFSHSYTLGVPRHLSKGFSRPIQLYAKGDFTPSHIQWSDTYHPQTPYEAYRGIYASIPRPVYPIWGSSDTPHGYSGSYSCRQTPMYSQPTSQYYNPQETDSYLPSYDTQVVNRHYVFASPLYQTVWSPPANLRNSSSHTPVFGSVRDAELEDGQPSGYHRHVYPPSTDETSSPNANGAFNSIREADTDDGSNQNKQHVYANCDSSSSPRVIDSETSDGPEDHGGGPLAILNGCCDTNSSD